MIRLGLSLAAVVSVVIFLLRDRPSDPPRAAAGSEAEGGPILATVAPFEEPHLRDAPAPPEGPGARRFASADERDRLIARLREVRRSRERSQKTYDFAGAPVAQDGAGPTLPAPRSGELDKEYIRDRIGEIVPLVRECYELSLAEDESLQGTLAVDFVIDAEEEIGGYVAEAAVAEDSELRNLTLDECVTETVLSLEFPPPEGGGTVRVRYPFVFASE